MGTSASSAEPAPGPRTGVLLVRAWIEPDSPDTVRARLLTTEDDSPRATTWATAAGDQAICDEFLRWLRRLRSVGSESGSGAGGGEGPAAEAGAQG